MVCTILSNLYSYFIPFWSLSQKARLARDSEKALIRSQRKQASRRRPPPVVQSYYSSGPQSSSSAAGLGQSLELKQRVVIDGVVFEFEEGGSKLKRMDEISTSPYATTPGARAESTTNANANATPTRHSLSMSGHQYLRTKNGNLIAAEKVRRRKSFGGSEGQSSSKNARGYVHSYMSLFGNSAGNENQCRESLHLQVLKHDLLLNNSKYRLKLVQKIDEPCRYFTKTGKSWFWNSPQRTHSYRTIAETTLLPLIRLSPSAFVVHVLSSFIL